MARDTRRAGAWEDTDVDQGGSALRAGPDRPGTSQPRRSAWDDALKYAADLPDDKGASAGREAGSARAGRETPSRTTASQRSARPSEPSRETSSRTTASQRPERSGEPSRDTSSRTTTSQRSARPLEPSHDTSTRTTTSQRSIRPLEPSRETSSRRPAQTGARVGQPADAAASPRRRTVTERPRTEGVTAYRQRRETAEDMARGGTGYGRADARRNPPLERPRPADRDADDRTAALRGGRHGGGGRPSVDQPTPPERKAPGGPLAWFSGLTGRGRAAAGASLIAVLGILVLAALLVTLLHDDSVKLTSVMVYGQSGYTDEQVISMAGLRIGMPMSAVDVDDIYGNFSVNPDVRLDEAVIDTEQSVRLNVGRRTAKAAVSCTGIILVIDEEGVIMERRSEAPEGGLVIIRGMDVTIGSSGRRIESSKAWQMDAMLQILSALEDHDMIGMTAEMSLLDRFNIYLTTRSGIRVIIGEAVDVDNKMLWAETVLAQLAQDGIRRGVVDVSTGKNAVYAEQ